MDDALVQRIAFYVFAVVAVVSALAVIGNKNPVASAMSLVTTFIAVAGLYLTMGATFLSAVQILVYAGAIMVLFLFVIMLLNLSVDPDEVPSVGRVIGGALGVALLLASVAWLAGGPDLGGGSLRPGGGEEIGRLFSGDYLFPFEMASLLLLIAMVGAIVLGRRRTEGDADRSDLEET